MRPQTFLIVLLALVCGGSAAFGINRWLDLRQEPLAAPETTGVVVAATDLPPFAIVNADMVKLQDCPKNLVPSGAMTRVEDAMERAVLNPIVKGETLLDGKLAPRGAGRGMAAKIPKGKRAFTIHTPTIE